MSSVTLKRNTIYMGKRNQTAVSQGSTPGKQVNEEKKFDQRYPLSVDTSLERLHMRGRSRVALVKRKTLWRNGGDEDIGEQEESQEDVLSDEMTTNESSDFITIASSEPEILSDSIEDEDDDMEEVVAEEEKKEEADFSFTYKPRHFLRTHCRNDDPSDVQTQVWHCAFEPDPYNPCKTTGVVATCGGSSICFIRVSDGEVLLKYDKVSKPKVNSHGDLDCEVHAMAWTVIPVDSNGRKTRVLAAGGTRSKVILIRPDDGICFDAFSTTPSTKRSYAVISSLLFHPKKPTWLFCGHEDGHIQIWDIGSPSNMSAPSFRLKKTLFVPSDLCHVYNMAFSPMHDLLLAGCDGGLVSWDAHIDMIKNDAVLIQTRFHLPDVDDSGFTVDSICFLRDDLLAVKCALHGFIYIFAISRVIHNRAQIGKKMRHECEVPESVILKLKWSDTDNFYMNMGVDSKSCQLVCGDDAGALWVYNLSPYVDGSINSPISGGDPIDPVEPTLKLSWPHLEDLEVEKAGKLPLTAHDIVMERCTISWGGKYIVAVTSNNMVCIWER